MLPLRLRKVTRRSGMVGSNLARQSRGMMPSRVGTKCTPPIPCAAASQAPMTPGCWGITSLMRVGRRDNVWARCRKSSRKSWTDDVRRMRLASGKRNACCKVLKSHGHLGCRATWIVTRRVLAATCGWRRASECKASRPGFREGVPCGAAAAGWSFGPCRGAIRAPVLRWPKCHPP
jgi:hypothetical protein